MTLDRVILCCYQVQLEGRKGHIFSDTLLLFTQSFSSFCNYKWILAVFTMISANFTYRTYISGKELIAFFHRQRPSD